MSEEPYRHRFTDLTDALIPIYNWGFRVLGGRGHQAFRQRIVDLADLSGDEHLLDAGCGTGLMALRIAAQYPGCTVQGIDLSPRMIAVARHDATAQGLAVDFRVGSIVDLPDAMNAALLFANALRTTGGDASAEAMIPAMEGMEFDGPKGVIFIRPEDHVAIQDMYIVTLTNIDDPEFKYFDAVTTARPDVP